MKIFSIRAKWFLSFAFAALLVTSTFTGCENNNNALTPSTAGQIHNPTSANPRAINGADLSHAMDIQNRHTDELMAIDGVNGTGTGLNEDGAPAVYVFTTRDNVHGIPSSIEGIRTHVQNIGEIVAYNTPGVYSGVYRSPMSSGVSVGNDNECAAGTISCVVTDGTNKYLLSNNHVFARVNKAAIGERIDQPGRYDNNCNQAGEVATLSKFIPINFNKRATNTIDCAIAEIFGTPGQTTTSVAGYTPSLITKAATVGQLVEKTGRTTGQTHGSVSAVNATVSVSYGNGQTAKFINQIYISSTTFSAAGDSGSLIVTDDANNNPVGLLFAGSSSSTIANEIGNVLTALRVTIIPN